MKKAIKKILYKLFSKEYKDIYKEIEEYKYISFDIFDTLIKRNVEKPTDIFELIPKRYGKELKNFKERRINAEHIARKQSKYEDVTLEEVYNCLEYPEEEKKKLINIEIELEKEYCTTNKEMLELYNYLIENNKKIYLTSDMYLSKEIIKDILKSNGYSKYEAIYLSSDKKVSKRSGNLFKSILKEEKISNNQLVHIGDNFIGDYLSPIKLNIKAVLIKTKVENGIFESKHNKTLEYNILSSFINNNIDYNADEYSKFGYEILGPILYSFTSWIHKKVKEDKIEKIYFLARDAKIIMEVYKKRYNEEIPIYYLNVSRKSILTASLVKVDNLNDILNRYKSILNSTVSVASFLKILNLDINNYKEVLYENKISLNMKVLTLDNNSKDKLFNIIKAEIINNSRKQNNYLKNYLKQNEMYGKVALVDIGWNGTIQYYLKDFSKANMCGYYYGVNNDKKYNLYKEIYKEGYLFDQNQLDDEQIIIYLNIGVFEVMFLALEGTTLAYEMRNNKVYPILDKEEYSNVSGEIVKNIQKYSKNFIDDVNNSNIKNYFEDMDKYVYFKNFKDMTIYPSLEIIKMFKNIEFKNVDVSKLVDNKSIFYYLIHPKKFYEDFINTGCKIWFLKNIFKIKLPYYSFLRKMYIKKKSL